jgi:hypothetical protein
MKRRVFDGWGRVMRVREEVGTLRLARGLGVSSFGE